MLAFKYGTGNIPTFLWRAEKIYNQAKVGNSMKFELLRDAPKSDLVFFRFKLFWRSKTYEGIQKPWLEYAESIKMIEDSATLIFQKTKKNAVDKMEYRTD